MIPRSEHPNPQFERENWLNLNGEWEFELDQAKSGWDKGYQRNNTHFTGKITVPFCPESKLSGVGHRDFINACWYRKDIELTESQLENDVLLHIGACDYLTGLYVNGQEVGFHRGGYTPVDMDITAFLRPGSNSIVVYAEDDTRSPMQARGKQSENFYSQGCDYTRTTGIWQTVWLEFVPKIRVLRVRYFPELHGSVNIQVQCKGRALLQVRTFYKGRPMGETAVEAAGTVDLHIDLAETHLWEAGHGRLYDVEILFGQDRVRSYFGLRTVRLDGMRFLINERPVFQRLVLDQGYYRDGIYTAPTEEDLIKDIQISLDAGFNGARLHQKTFEPRFLYHCDRMGYLVWDEYGNWGVDVSDFKIMANYIPEWLEEIERDFNHPSIIGWCPFNETWDYRGRTQDNDILRDIYLITKAADPTRPCIDTSGVFHVMTDIFDIHEYEQNPEVFKAAFDGLRTEGGLPERFLYKQTYKGEPVFISEYGGIKWAPGTEGGWGYGDAPASEQAFIERYRGLTEALLDNPKICGFCYTQLYDIEQEQNGLYYYDRSSKFAAEIFKKINSKKAAIEEEV